MKDDTANTAHDLARHDVTPEVGSEGGTPGDLEQRVTRDVGTGSEGTETWRPGEQEKDDLVRDEVENGRRNP